MSINRIVWLSLAMLVALPGRVAADDASAWMGFEIVAGNLVVPARSGALATGSLLTAGSATNGVSRDFLQSLAPAVRSGLQPRQDTAAGWQVVGDVRRLPVNLFGFNMILRDVAVLESFDSGLLLGTPFLRKAVVQIDFPRARLRYLYRKAIDLRGYANLRMRRPSELGDALVVVQLPGGDSLWLSFLSGGFDEMYLDRTVARAHGLLDRYPVAATTRQTALGPLQFERLTLPTLQLGPYELERVAVIVPTAEAQQRLQERGGATGYGIGSASGSLGYDLLSHFVVSVDYKRALVHIESR